MDSVLSVSPSDLQGRVYRVQLLTIGWMSVEAVVALSSAWKARSPALLGFGGDSVIELLSAILVLWRFGSNARFGSARAEKLAARLAGALLFAVALCVAASSAFSFFGYNEPRKSVVGIALLLVAAFGMPWLAKQKRALAAQLSSPSMKADATESSLCGYLSCIALIGLAANALFGIRWADPLAALALIPFVVKEGWESMHASRPGCGCCC